MRSQELETALKRDNKELGVTLRHELRELESRTTIKLGGTIVAAIAALAVLMKLL